jgi:hypothetical protein
VSTLEMIYSIQVHICKLYVNTEPFYIRDLSIADFGIHGVSWNQSQLSLRGTTTWPYAGVGWEH